MATHDSPELTRLIAVKMASGRYASEVQLLVEALQAMDESETELRAIEEGLASLDRGEAGVSLDEAIRRLREKHLTDKAT